MRMIEEKSSSKGNGRRPLQKSGRQTRTPSVGGPHGPIAPRHWSTLEGPEDSTCSITYSGSPTLTNQLQTDKGIYVSTYATC